MPTAPVNLLNIGTGPNAPAPSSDLLAQLIKQEPKSFADITGLSALKEAQIKSMELASAARKEAMDAGKAMADKVIDKLS